MKYNMQIATNITSTVPKHNVSDCKPKRVCLLIHVSEVNNTDAPGECQLLHSHPSQIDDTTLIKNLLDFSRSLDQRPPGSFLHKREEPENEVARSAVLGVSPGRGYQFRPAIYTRGKERISEI
jgi:hypothetical protein